MQVILDYSFARVRGSLRVAQVCPRYYPHIGGIETHVMEISGRLTRYGFDVDILTTDPSGKLEPVEQINGVTVRRFKSWAPHESYFYSKGLGKYLRRNVKKYDILHAHSYHALPALQVSRVAKGFFFTPHYLGRGHSFFTNLLHAMYKPVGGHMVRKASRLFCVSNYERNLLNEAWGVCKKTVLVGNGINPYEFEEAAGVEKCRNKILSVARLEKYKGMQYLIRVLTAERLAKFTLEIIGRGPYEPNLVSLARSLGVQDRVTFTSGLTRPELVKKFVEAGVFCLLSKYECSGITVMEALAAHTPCIVADESGLPEWVDNVNCFATPLPPNLPQLAKLIATVSGCKTSGVNLLTWDDVASKVIATYQELTATRV